MTWEFIVALIVAVPLITFPAVFVWYVNAGGLYHAIKEKISARSSKRHVSSHPHSREIEHHSAGRPTGAL